MFSPNEQIEKNKKIVKRTCVLCGATFEGRRGSKYCDYCHPHPAKKYRPPVQL